MITYDGGGGVLGVFAMLSAWTGIVRECERSKFLSDSGAEGRGGGSWGISNGLETNLQV